MIKQKKLLFTCIAILLVLFAFISIIGKNTTSAAFLASSQVGVNVECGSFSDMFIVEIYDGNNLITENDIEFNKEYTVKVYNKSNLKCDFYLTTDGTEINTFSQYVTITLSEDHNYNTSIANSSSIRSGVRLSNTNKTIISVSSFDPNTEPMIYKIKISTDALKLIAQNAPDRIVDFDFDLKLSFIASTTSN